jgi:tRNA pseudouridine55 synthase
MNGVLIVDKPPGVTSHDVVNLARKVSKISKIGHTGTLDPFATGVLPLCFGEATKIARFLMEDDKEYLATMRLGQETDTYDLTGKVVKESEKIYFGKEEIREVFKEFEGKIKQVPPFFSAKKYHGLPLYRWRRRGVTVNLSEEEVEVFRIEIKELSLPHLTFAISCSKGTYIRTLANDIGRRLGCGAHLTNLRRLRSGRFHISSALSIDRIVFLAKKGLLKKELIPLNGALSHFEELKVGSELVRKVQNGGQILVRDLEKVSMPTIMRGERVKVISNKGNLIAIVVALMDSSQIYDIQNERKFFRLIRVFCE